MNLHEYQAKQLFREYGIPVPDGEPARTLGEAVAVAGRLAGGTWVVKAQVHAGGRGKAGGVRKVTGMAALSDAATGLIGSRLVTPQTGEQGLPVHAVLVEKPTLPARELYVACLIDRVRERVVLVASTEGGMNIEAVAVATPAAIHSVTVQPAVGLQGFQCRELAFALGLHDGQIREFTDICSALYRMFIERDLSLVEVNPLGVDTAGHLVALDAKINVDDSALYRQPALATLRDESQEDTKEVQARTHDLNYVALDGDIGCMVNGAGLAMATMDIIRLKGGAPANFLDVGGGTTAARVTEAFKILLSDCRVKAVLVNIFGGIVRCDLIAEGVIQAIREMGVTVPVVVRLEGTRAAEGRDLISRSGLGLHAADDLGQAAAHAVALAHSLLVYGTCSPPSS